VHYLGKVPDRFTLYQPYSNRNCLHCHEDARRFVEAAPHQGLMPALASGQTSCLRCHNLAHDLTAARTRPGWQPR